jgi:hypothetical protein
LVARPTPYDSNSEVQQGADDILEEDIWSPLESDLVFNVL